MIGDARGRKNDAAKTAATLHRRDEMGDSLSRRDWLRALGAAGAAAGLGTVRSGRAEAHESGAQRLVAAAREVHADRASPSLVAGHVLQPRRG